MKIKNVKRVLQITSVFGVVASTIIATTQRVYNEKDKSIFNIDNFEQYTHKVLGAPSAVGDKFKVHANEKAQWGLIGGEIECQILQEASVTGSGSTAKMIYGTVKVLRNTDSNNRRIMEDPTIPAFVTGDDNYTYIVYQLDDYLFADSTAENSYTTIQRGSSESTFRLPYSLEKIGTGLTYNQPNFSCKKFAWTTNFDTIDSADIFSKKLLSNGQVKEVTLNNVSVYKKTLQSEDGLFYSVDITDDVLTTAKTNRIVSQQNTGTKDLFFSCKKIDTVLQSGYTSSVVDEETKISLVNFDDFKSFKTTAWELERTKTKYPNYVGKIESSSLVCDDVQVEMPSDYELIYDTDYGGLDIQERFQRKLYAFSDTFFLDDNQDILLDDEINVTFDFPDFPELKNNFYFDAGSRDKAHIAAVSADGFKVLEKDKKYPVNFTVTSKIDPNIKKTYSFVITNISQPPVESVTVNPITIKEVGETQPLTATVNPQDADQKVMWSIAANPSDAAVIENSNILKFNKTGTFTVTATSTSDPTKSGTSDQITILPKSVTNIDLDKKTMTGIIGFSDTIHATVTPVDTDKTLNWESSNDAIVRIEREPNMIDCKVLLIGAGTAVITATSAITPSVSATCTITVNKPAPISVTIDPATLEGKIGEESSLTATVEPAEADQSVTWSSGDENIATVDANGHVSMKKTGTCEIYATSVDDTSKKGVCQVTVGENPLTNFEINTNGKTSFEVNEPNIIFKIVVNQGADNDATWESSDDTIATIEQNGKITFNKEGIVTIKATSKIDSSKTDSIEIKVVKQSELPWGIIGGSIGGVVGVAAIGGTTFGIIKKKK